MVSATSRIACINLFSAQDFASLRVSSGVSSFWDSVRFAAFLCRVGNTARPVCLQESASCCAQVCTHSIRLRVSCCAENAFARWLESVDLTTPIQRFPARLKITEFSDRHNPQKTTYMSTVVSEARRRNLAGERRRIRRENARRRGSCRQVRTEISESHQTENS